MSQHDYNIANQAGAGFRADLNSALLAIVSANSAATEPATMFAYQYWADTTTGILKQRNAANTAWISILTLSTGKALLAAAADTATNQSGGSVNATTSAFSGLMSLNGGQIKFPATQVPSADANTLDDYEEGTWTPSVGGTATYTFQIGRYTKIGNSVAISMEFQINVIGTGSLGTISGLPFTVNNRSAFPVRWGSTNGTYVYIVGHGVNATIEMYAAVAATASLALTGVMTSGTNIVVGGSYHAV